MPRSRGEKLFGLVNGVLLTVLAVVTAYPFLYTVSISLSSAAEAERSGFHIVPGNSSLLWEAFRETFSENDDPNEPHRTACDYLTEYGDGLSLVSYRKVLSDPDIRTGYLNSIGRTVLGTLATLFMTCLIAYPLSRRCMPWRRSVMWLLLFTMIFSGGLIPTYILISRIGLIDRFMVYILPGLLSGFSVIVVKNFFQAVPESLGEAARMDGASEWAILWRIYVPLSKPVLATVALWTAVAHWNAWFDAMLYVHDRKLQVLQSVLRRIVIEGNTELVEKGLVQADQFASTPETIKAATVVITILPILLVCPFVQRFFVKGIMLGSVKE